MASPRPSYPGPSDCLHIYYDCEATGEDLDCDRIIEMAAVVSINSKDSATSTAERGESVEKFQSLCYTDREVGPIARELTRLTNQDLLDKPHLPVVLEQLLDWVGRMVERASSQRGERCTPVLVAHGGFLLDFPMLMAATERAGGGHSQVLSSALYCKIRGLNLHFADSSTTCKRLGENNDPVMQGVESKKQSSLYRWFFGEDYTAHRALNDAQALHRLLTESPLKRCLDQLVMKSPQQAYNHWKAVQMKSANVTFEKAKALVRRGVYLEHMQQRYNQSPNHEFNEYLRSLGIRRPELGLLGYFEKHKNQ